MTDPVDARCLRNPCCSANAVPMDPKTTIHETWELVLFKGFLLKAVKYLRMG